MTELETQQEVNVEITGDGNPFNTKVLVDGKPLTNVLAVRYEISPRESKVVVDLDWVDIHYTGPAITNVVPPTARDVLRFWWWGVRRRPRRLREALKGHTWKGASNG